jgi:hypothetical protein
MRKPNVVCGIASAQPERTAASAWSVSPRRPSDSDRCPVLFAGVPGLPPDPDACDQAEELASAEEGDALLATRENYQSSPDTPPFCE